jgi:hypothetical protein
MTLELDMLGLSVALGLVQIVLASQVQACNAAMSGRQVPAMKPCLR